jgi:mono/diheme cytochrome c family protein
VGVNLGDEQILQEPAHFSAMVRAGRGQMPPNPDLTDAQLAELRAWLETL